MNIAYILDISCSGKNPEEEDESNSENDAGRTPEVGGTPSVGVFVAVVLKTTRAKATAKRTINRQLMTQLCKSRATQTSGTARMNPKFGIDVREETVNWQ